MTRSDPPESRRLTALVDLLRSTVKQPSQAELGRGLNVLLTQSAPPRGRRMLGWSVAALLVSSLSFSAVAYLASRPDLSAGSVAVDKIEGGELLDGGYLSELGDSGITLSFNEGSRFALEPGSRGRLRVAPAEGARLALERGKVACRITENLDNRWSVEAGPFVVTVRGTDFAVEWDPAHEQLEVSLRRGRVAVSGPFVEDELVLTPGQTLTVSLPRGETVIRQGDSKRSSLPEQTVSAPPASGATAEAEAPASNTASSSNEPKSRLLTQAAASAAPESERAWREAIATGQWDRILADVDRDGAASILKTLSSADLFALADAARYRRRADLARAALLEQRRRFPRSPRSLDALFLLARVEEQGAGKRQAIQRYDEYLAQAPGGTYAAEALGRRMILTQAVEGAASARRIADEYLRRFPRGSYAKAARTLRQLP